MLGRDLKFIFSGYSTVCRAYGNMEMFYYIVFVLEVILEAMGSLLMVITNKMYKLIIGNVI